MRMMPQMQQLRKQRRRINKHNRLVPRPRVDIGLALAGAEHGVGDYVGWGDNARGGGRGVPREVRLTERGGLAGAPPDGEDGSGRGGGLEDFVRWYG